MKTVYPCDHCKHKAGDLDEYGALDNLHCDDEEYAEQSPIELEVDVNDMELLISMIQNACPAFGWDTGDMDEVKRTVKKYYCIASPAESPVPKCPYCGVEIEDHPVGRCLDVWIWQDVYGCSAPVWDDQDLEPIYPETRSVVIPHYSTDGNASGDLMKKEHISLLCSEDGWYAVVTEDIFHANPRHGELYGSKEIHGKHQALAETMHLAVCRAALLKAKFVLRQSPNPLKGMGL
jgi:hypothetical protein